MRARIRFVNRPYFNYPPDKLVCPGILLHRGEDRRMWTMVFVVSKQVSALVYEGDLTWMVEPREQDFGKGVRFQLVANPNGRPLDSKLRDNVPGPHLSKRSANPAPSGPQEKPADKPPQPIAPIGGKDKVGKANPHGAGGPPADPGGGPPPGHGGGPPTDPGSGHPQPHPKIPHPTPDLFTAVPKPGLFAEGELLG